MSTNKHIDKICYAILAACLILTALFINGAAFGIEPVSAAAGYASRLLNPSTVHTIDIVMDDWDSFIESCTDETYKDCTVSIDGEVYQNVAIRAKGNTSLTSVKSYGNDRYSFKIEFDHYNDSTTYHGLDKLCLNNIIQDNTYMKDYIVYQLMGKFGVDTPLCSYSYITVNGEDWGLYLAVEGVEESFLERNYGKDYGQLYKPDSMDMGGGPGNGRNFSPEDIHLNQLPNSHERPEKFPEEKNPSGMPPDMGSNDVALIYTDDKVGSYANIFDSAKTNPSNADKKRLITSLKKLNNTQDLENTVNIEEVIRYFVVHNFVLNFDSYTGNMMHNYYLYEKNGQLSMIPWDYNLAFGGFESQADATGLANYPIDTPVSGTTLESRPMLAWIFSNAEYTQLYHQYFKELIENYFSNGYFEKWIDSTQEMIAPYVEKDPTKFCTYEEFEKGVSALKELCTLRAESINGQLNGTIPATAEEQTENSSSLIDASTITVADMGNMNAMKGGSGMPDHFTNKRNAPRDAFPPVEMPDNTPDTKYIGNNIPDKPRQSYSGNIAFSLALLGTSAALLFLGILVVFFYRRKGQIIL